MNPKRSFLFVYSSLSPFIKQLAKQEGVTEKLKSTAMMSWVRKMNNIRNRVTEIVCAELIYTV